jgi:1-acyl-sn-glycerol-3-phosphate acyltransferase
MPDSGLKRFFEYYVPWYIPLAMLRPMLRMTFGVTCYGLEHLPSGGAALLCSNHGTYLDPLILGSFLPRRFRFVAKSELFEYPGVKQFCEIQQCLMVHRGEPDRKLFQQAEAVLSGDTPLLIFPEGMRVHQGIGEVEPGAGLIAMRSRAPVIPIALRGHQEAWPERAPLPFFLQGKSIEIRIGQPVELADLYEKKPQGRAAREAAQRIIKAIADLYWPPLGQYQA